MKRPIHPWKRLIDVMLALLGLVVLGPTMLITSIGLRVSTGATPIFRQRRAGADGRAFVILKFRTMTEATDSDGRLLTDSQRLTTFGRAVRSLSIDELPQLINVLRGEMSIVGPRPLPTEYVALYDARERMRLEVPPGITGLAQTSGRHTISFGERLAYDTWYVQHWSLLLDLKIMAGTLPQLIRRSDVAVVQDMSQVDDRGFAKFWQGSRAGEVERLSSATERRAASARQPSCR